MDKRNPKKGTGHGKNNDQIMSPTVSGDDTLIFFRQCAYRDHICMVGHSALCSCLSYGMGLDQVSSDARR